MFAKRVKIRVVKDSVLRDMSSSKNVYQNLCLRHVEKCSDVVEEFKHAKFKHLSKNNLFYFTLTVYMLQI